MLAAFAGAHNGSFAQTFNKVEPHIGQGGLTIQPGFTFQFGNRVAQQFLLVLIQIQRFFNQRIALHKFGRGKAHRQARAGGVIFNQMVHSMDTAMHRAALAVASIAKVDAAGRLAVAGHMQGVFDQFVDTLVFGGRDGHDRNAEQFLQLVDHDRAAIGADFVHHI